jgi:hypothetical protein
MELHAPNVQKDLSIVTVTQHILSFTVKSTVRFYQLLWDLLLKRGNAEDKKNMIT